MSIEPIGIATILIGIISLFLEPAVIVYVFVCSTLLGSAGAIILVSLGGTNIQPAHILLGFLVMKLLSDRQTSDYAGRGLSPGWAGFWLTMTLIYCVLSAYIMPRLFFGQTFVFPARALGPYKSLLEPTTANLTQTIYLIGNFLCFTVFFGFASSYSGQRLLARAVLACAVADLVFAGLDLATYYTRTAEVLSFMRNSSYAMMSDGEEAGFKRIVGSFTEASSFSYVTIGYLGFTAKLWLRNVEPRLTLTVTVLLLIALLFSTSTTAYVGLAIFLMVLYADAVLCVLRETATKRMVLYVVGAPLALFLVVLVVLLNEDWSSSITGMADTMILNKMQTTSGVERSGWNAQAIQNFKDTMGFGVGNGSLRTSSFPLALLASQGVVGTLTYSLFVLYLWIGKKAPLPASSVEVSIQQAARTACLGWLIAASLSGAFIDLGLPFFILAALGSAQPGYFSRRVVPVGLGTYSRASR